MKLQLTGSVGRGGENRAADVKLVQALLNVHRRQQGLPPLPVDARPGADLDAAIARFQNEQGVRVASGFVGTNSQTWSWLLYALAGARTTTTIMTPAKGRLTWGFRPDTGPGL